MAGVGRVGLLAGLAQAHGPQFLVAELARELVGKRLARGRRGAGSPRSAARRGWARLARYARLRCAAPPTPARRRGIDDFEALGHRRPPLPQGASTGPLADWPYGVLGQRRQPESLIKPQLSYIAAAAPVLPRPDCSSPYPERSLTRPVPAAPRSARPRRSSLAADGPGVPRPPPLGLRAGAPRRARATTSSRSCCAWRPAFPTTASSRHGASWS